MLPSSLAYYSHKLRSAVLGSSQAPWASVEELKAFVPHSSRDPLSLSADPRLAVSHSPSLSCLSLTLFASLPAV